MEYTDKTMEHFMCPQNVGSMPDADAIGHTEILLAETR